MFETLFVFFLFSITAIILRFIIGNPINSSRMQTKYKFQSIPNVANILLFYNTSKKPVSIHIIVFQILNYIMFIVSTINNFSDIDFYKYYLNIVGLMGLFIVILPLAIETVIIMILGEEWETDDEKVKISFANYTISSLSKESLVTLSFGIYFKNKIVFLNEESMIVAEGTIDFLNKKIFFSKSYSSILNLKVKENTISFSKYKSKK